MKPRPLGVKAGARGVLFFGGTFDPPHRAHVDLPRSVRDRLLGRGWWLVYVPAARNPLKASAPVATDTQRLDMLRLATARVPRCTIWTDEIDRATKSRRPSYWIDTLERAASLLPPGTPMRFILGSDAAVGFHRWRRPRDILALAEPIVMLRPPHRTLIGVLRGLRAAGFWDASELELWRSSIDDHAIMPHAATMVRESLVTGAGARALLAPSVSRYIASERLYAVVNRSKESPTSAGGSVRVRRSS